MRYWVAGGIAAGIAVAWYLAARDVRLMRAAR